MIQKQNSIEDQKPVLTSIARRGLASADSLVSSASGYVGFPAIMADGSYNPFEKGNNQDGFDCSGFSNFLLKNNDINIFVRQLGREARSAREFLDYVDTPIEFGEHRKGDLCFFSYDGAMPTHKALYVGDNKIIHKGFVDLSLVPVEPTGGYRKRIIISDLDAVSNDRRNAGNPIRYKPARGIQRHYGNPIGFNRIV